MGEMVSRILDPRDRVELRRRQLAALTAMVMASARVQSVVLPIEDLHWADPTTLDVLRRPNRNWWRITLRRPV
jgi:predicted ATPase